MRHALRRVLWVLPTLILVSLVAFALLTNASSSKRPRFFNSSPSSVEELALVAMTTIATDAVATADRAQAEATLVRLGGAALPHVLPRLDTLEPRGRGRVAVALRPVAQRMGIARPGDFDTPDDAVLFWTRFWEDRGVEFRPVVVRRAVQRLRSRGSRLRRAEVQEFDTFALSALIAALELATDDAGVERNRRLLRMAAHVTNKREWTIAAGATRGDANLQVRRWRAWWQLNRSDFISFDGLDQLTAMVLETEYGQWVLAFFTRSVLTKLSSAAGVTVLLVLTVVAAAWLGASAMVLVSEWVGPGIARHLAHLLLIASAALPATLIAPLKLELGLAVFALTLVNAALASRHVQGELGSARHRDVNQYELALGLPNWVRARRLLRAASSSLAALLPSAAPLVLTQVFVVERALAVRGLSQTTLEALSRESLPELMGLVLVCAVLVSLLQVVGDLLLWALDARARPSLARRRGAIE